MKHRIEATVFHSIKISGINLIIVSTLGIFLGGYWAFTGFFIVFVYYFLAEMVLGLIGVGATINAVNEFEFISPTKPSLIDRFGIPYYAISQILCLPVCFYLLTFKASSAFEVTGGVLSLVFASGSIGGIAGHDLIHSKKAPVRWLGFLTLTSMNYGHFAISHVMGHHRTVGLKDDWSTARYRESVYHFLYRAIVHGYRAAWILENQRTQAQGKSWFSIHNQMVQLSLVQAALTLSILYFGGLKMLAIHSIFSLVALSFLEIVNYVSHYGLVRRADPLGALEKISNTHSWESNNKISNWFIFNTGKHCHHHRRPSAKNYELVLAHENSMIPYGLQLMTIMSFIPPIYFRVMDGLLLERNAAPVGA